MADDGYIKAGKSVPTESWLMNAGAAIAERIEMRAVDGHAGVTPSVTRDMAVTDTVTNALLGGIWRLWVYADSEIRRDNTLNLTRGGVANLMRVPVWWLDFIPEKWLKFYPDGVTVELPNYCEKNRVTAKDVRKEIRQIQRPKDAERKRRSRANKKRSHARHAGVTRESRASHSESHASVTAPTGTGTVTGRPIPVESGGKSSDATTAALASANGTSRSGPNSAAGEREPLHERQRKARTLKRLQPAFERALLRAMYHLTESELDEALAEIATPQSPPPETDHAEQT